MTTEELQTLAKIADITLLLRWDRSEMVTKNGRCWQPHLDMNQTNLLLDVLRSCKKKNGLIFNITLWYNDEWQVDIDTVYNYRSINKSLSLAICKCVVKWSAEVLRKDVQENYHA